MYSPQIPDPCVYKMSDMLDGQVWLMHSETLKNLVTMLEAANDG